MADYCGRWLVTVPDNDDRTKVVAECVTESLARMVVDMLKTRDQ